MSNVWYWAVDWVAFGIIFGVFREYAAQWIQEKEGYRRKYPVRCALKNAVALFCFPLSTLVDGDLDDATLLARSKGGIPYWLIMGIVWPVSLVWPLLACIVISVVVWHLSEPRIWASRIIERRLRVGRQFYGSFEDRVRRAVGIPVR